MKSLLAVLLLSSCVHAQPQPSYSARLPAHLIDIEDVTASDMAPVTAKFDELVGAGEHVVGFAISSFGGEVITGFEFLRHVQEAKRKTGVQTVCVVDYKAMSMGFILLQSICDVRLATPGSILMAHGAATQASGKMDDIKGVESELAALNAAIAHIAAARLHISTEEYLDRTAHADWFMSVDDALKVGALDGVVDPSDVPSLFELSKPELTGLPFP